MYKLETKEMFEIRHLFSISQSLDCHYNFIHNLIFSYLRFGDTFQGLSSFLFYRQNFTFQRIHAHDYPLPFRLQLPLKIEVEVG